ncbi:methylenetetrahydrofolate reductase (NAD(P)H) met13 [Coniosporium apollinis]|uniref:Methylenetetrahydrofolate reductase (NAD(P)H) met13 n=2 Tax=Coniosporium TaxID=2810619 RepID=A0ABQ9P609_9PEZI|nr:methylenetetrahydrofolate reductase (NAD(P)H) met13 [Cladosporium sp. JES 115]KAJ9669792.1 methylenetetrahydrofolate reductase (NAD(P)H) met13 [Coniosporium apollinis]
MHISEKLAEAQKAGKPSYSFEFFPPKTAQGVQNLYDRMDRMHGFGPSFIDITWGAGGRHSQLTCEMVKTAQSAYGLETCMHLTCTDMDKSKIDDALREAYNAGCTNILALRGDPPREREKWEAKAGGFRYAKDLVKYIKEKYGNHFDIGVAGYSEGCEDQEDADLLIDHLKEKVDAGGTFVITQMFYDVDIFLDWVRKCRAKGITVPIIPGIMPIHTYAAFLRRAHWTKCHVPEEWTKALEPVKNDDAEVREVGKDLVVKMCRRLLDAGIIHLHFYTMNLAQATRMVLEELGITPDLESPLDKPLPWRQSLGLNRRDENVRPIFWRNRNRSYVARTQDWDEFPNGRWGDSRSPAFGELDAYGIGLKGTNEQNVKLWGQPRSVKDIANLFVRYMQGKLESLPWSEAPISSEADVIKDNLIDLNQRGLLTINSQPAVDGAKSSDPVYGWGPRNGYVYQKAYLEVLVSPEVIAELITRIERNPDLTYYAVNKQGDLKTNAPGDGPNAVTWGVFPGKEIVQPTIVETISFLAWKDEFFRLGHDWASCYSAANPSRYVIQDLMDNWYLVNIVHNDFHEQHGIFPLFEGLEVKDMEKPLHVNGEVATNGDAPESKPTTNGDRTAEPKPSTNGTKEEEKPAVNDGTEGWAKPAKKSNAPLPQTFPVPP